MRTLAMMAFSVLLGLTSAGCATAWPDMPSVRGVIVTAPSGALTVRHKSGREVSVELTTATIVTDDHAIVGAAALAPGRRVLILLETSRDTLIAREVQITSGRSP